MSLLDRLNFGWRARLPLMLQTEAAECGLACLAMVASYYGKPLDLADLRRQFAVSLKGINLANLVQMASQLGLCSRPLRLELEQMGLLQTPCILHWDLNHFVVLRSIARDCVVIHDPAFGVRRMSLALVSKHFTGVALELTPLAQFERAEPPPRVRFRSLLGRMVGIKQSLARLFALALAIEVFAVINPLFVQWVVDHALVTADRDLLLTLACGFALLLLLKTAVWAMRGWMLIALSAALKVQGRSNLLSHLLTLPTDYFEARYLGDVMSRFGSQEKMLQAITTDVVEAVLDGLLASITLVIMFVFAPMLATVVLVGSLLYGLLRWVLYTPLRQASAEAIVWGARGDSHFLETMRGIKTIKLFNALESRRTRWLNLLVETVNRQLMTQNLQLLFSTVNSLLIGALAILVIWLGAQRVLDNLMSVGMLLAFVAYKDQFLSRVSSLIDKAVDLTMLRLHAERLADIALAVPEPQDHYIADSNVLNATNARPPAAIEVRDLRYRYADNEPWVLDGINFRIEAGETVAVTGASGRGKTTLLKILASLLQPTHGEILVDDQPLARLGAAHWRSMIGVVMQDDQLFAGSICDNVSFFSPHPDAARIEKCCKLAAVHDEILAMPMGYNTLIGDMGAALSGGQKQRLLIARALYRQPSVLLLDEATSHLDLASERAVNTAIRATGMTRIIIAHRLETIRSTDRVIHLEHSGLVSLVPETKAVEVQ